MHAPPARRASPAHYRTDRRPSHRHATWTIALHWLSVLAIVITTVAGLSREWIEDDHLRSLALDIHRQSGLFVLVALVLRVAVRFGIGMADHAGDQHPLLRWAAHLAHFGLYLLLLAMPLLGLAASNAHAVRVSFFGLFALPEMVLEDADFADVLTDWHVWVAWGRTSPPRCGITTRAATACSPPCCRGSGAASPDEPAPPTAPGSGRGCA
jgi:cytochrome b561